MDGWSFVRTAAFVEPMIVILVHFQCGQMAPNNSLSRPLAVLTNCENRARLTGCSVLRLWLWPAGGSSEYWSPSFVGKDSPGSFVSFSATVFACFPSLSVDLSTVAPTRGLANFAALHTSPALRFSKWSFHIRLFECRIDLCTSAFVCTAASSLIPFPFSLPNTLLLSLVSLFDHLFDWVQILRFFTLASSSLLSISWHHSGSRSTSSPVHSSSRWALSPSSSFQKISAASSSSFDMVARFHPFTCTWCDSSFFSTLSSHSITSWSEPVACLPSNLVHLVIGRLARVRSIVDSPSTPFLVQWWVGENLLLTRYLWCWTIPIIATIKMLSTGQTSMWLGNPRGGGPLFLTPLDHRIWCVLVNSAAIQIPLLAVEFAI